MIIDPTIQLEIIFADETLIAVNKPAGLLSIPDGYDPTLPHVAASLARGFGKVWIVHRLDRETSGVMIVARTLHVHRELNLQFENRVVQKTYHALVAGFPDWEAKEVDAALRVNGDRKHRTVISPSLGKPAHTSFRVINRYPKGCMIEARPHTGYTHQIRAHLSGIGLPILGDKLYWKKEFKNNLAEPQCMPELRTCLHAHAIAFTHPISRLPIAFEAPYPADFQAALDSLR